MASKSPKHSQSPESDGEKQMITRSKDIKIQPRKPINESLRENSPLRYLEDSHKKKLMKEGSRSPAAQRKNENRLYPNLSIDDDDENNTDESFNKTPQKPIVATKDKNTPRPSVEPENSHDSSKYRVITVIVVAVVAALIGFYMYKQESSKEVPTKAAKNTVDCSEFMNLKDKFSNQDNKLFKSLKSGIEGMYKRSPQTPSVFTFFSTNDVAIDAILEEIVKIAKTCIKQESDPINLTANDLNSTNFIEQFKDELKTRKIMIVHNVDLMPSSNIHLLHSFADTYNPIVSESIIYFTVLVPEKPNGKPFDYIFSYLQEKWKDLASNKRDPLITRFLDQTFYIN